MVPLIVVIVLLVIGFVAWKALSGKSGNASQDATPYAEPAAPLPSQVAAPEVVQTYTAAPQVIQPQSVEHAHAHIEPVRTPRLDEPDAVRPDIDAAALASARANFGAAVPESVLADALLDATPDQLRQMFAAVPQDVVREAVGARDNVQQAPLKQEETAQLKGMADSLDDLDIWSFGETKA